MPLTLTVPVTYTWHSPGQPPIVVVRDNVWGFGWYGNSGWSNDTTWGSFTWTTPGTKTVTLTATNAAGSISSTYTVWVEQTPVLSLTGPTMGKLDTAYSFTLTVWPPTLTTPIQHYWFVTEQPFTTSAGLSATKTFSWTTPGTKVFQVWAIPSSGIETGEGASLVFKIPIPLPALTPTIESAGSGDWSDPATWDLGRVPMVTDVVLIHAGHVITASAALEVDSLINRGTLHGPAGAPLVITATGVLSNSGWIGAAAGGLSGATQPIRSNFHPACNGTGGIPGASI